MMYAAGRMRGLGTISIGVLTVVGATTCGDGRKVSPSETFCHDLLQQGCVRAFDCVPPADRNMDFYVQYGTSVEECRARPDRCAEYPAECPNFDVAIGSICLTDFTIQTCGQLLIIQNGVPVVALPPSCGLVCG